MKHLTPFSLKTSAYPASPTSCSAGPAATSAPKALWKPRPTITPDFSLRATSGGMLEVVWVKKEIYGIKREFNLGAVGMQTDAELNHS
jgi:hypothetical protein